MDIKHVILILILISTFLHLPTIGNADCSKCCYFKLGSDGKLHCTDCVIVQGTVCMDRCSSPAEGCLCSATRVSCGTTTTTSSGGGGGGGTTTTISCPNEGAKCITNNDCCTGYGISCYDFGGYKRCADKHGFKCAGNSLYYKSLLVTPSSACGYCCTNQDKCLGWSACCISSIDKCIDVGGSCNKDKDCKCTCNGANSDYNLKCVNNQCKIDPSGTQLCKCASYQCQNDVDCCTCVGATSDYYVKCENYECKTSNSEVPGWYECSISKCPTTTTQPSPTSSTIITPTSSIPSGTECSSSSDCCWKYCGTGSSKYYYCSNGYCHSSDTQCSNCCSCPQTTTTTSGGGDGGTGCSGSISLSLSP